jgi:hypothetical protein
VYGVSLLGRAAERWSVVATTDVREEGSASSDPLVSLAVMASRKENKKGV